MAMTRTTNPKNLVIVAASFSESSLDLVSSSTVVSSLRIRLLSRFKLVIGRRVIGSGLGEFTPCGALGSILLPDCFSLAFRKTQELVPQDRTVPAMG